MDEITQPFSNSSPGCLAFLKRSRGSSRRERGRVHSPMVSRPSYSVDYANPGEYTWSNQSTSLINYCVDTGYRIAGIFQGYKMFTVFLIKHVPRTFILKNLISRACMLLFHENKSTKTFRYNSLSAKFIPSKYTRYTYGTLIVLVCAKTQYYNLSVFILLTLVTLVTVCFSQLHRIDCLHCTLYYM